MLGSSGPVPTFSASFCQSDGACDTRLGLWARPLCAICRDHATAIGVSTGLTDTGGSPREDRRWLMAATNAVDDVSVPAAAIARSTNIRAKLKMAAPATTRTRVLRRNQDRPVTR